MEGTPADTTVQHLRGSSLLAVGRVMSVGIALLVQVFIVRYLTRQEYGALAFGLAVVSIASSIQVLGLDKTLARFLPMYEEEGRQELIIGALLVTAATIVALAFLIVTPIVLARDFVNQTLVQDDRAMGLLIILLFMAPIQALDAALVAIFAVFGNARSIFVRRYVLAPFLQLTTVLVVIVLDLGIVALALGYVVSATIGVLVYATILVRVLNARGLFALARTRRIKIPGRELLSFTLPLMSTDLVFVLRGSLVVIFLQAMHGVTAVASYRAVLPVARQNSLIQQNFSYLFVPLAARLYTNRKLKDLNDVYWETAMWIALFTFPIFVASFSLATPITILLFGERYADAAAVLSWLALGFYFNAAMGLNGLTLRVFGRVRFIVAVDLITAALSVVGTLILIERLGAVGGAIGVSATLIIQNLLYQAGLARLTGLDFLPRRFTVLYAILATSAVLMLLFQQTLNPPTPVGLMVGSAVVVVVMFVGRRSIGVATAFPEVARLPLIGRLFR